MKTWKSQMHRAVLGLCGCMEACLHCIPHGVSCPSIWSPKSALPGPHKYVQKGRSRLCLKALGHYFAHFWGAGSVLSLPNVPDQIEETSSIPVCSLRRHWGGAEPSDRRGLSKPIWCIRRGSCFMHPGNPKAPTYQKPRLRFLTWARNPKYLMFGYFGPSG